MDQLSILMLHRSRELVLRMKLQASNQLLALLAEFGNATFTSKDHLVRTTAAQFALTIEGLPPLAHHSLQAMHSRLKGLNEEQRQAEDSLFDWHANDAASARLGTVPGFGYLVASALAALLPSSVQTGMNSRSFAASLGLVPTEHSTGERRRLGKISRAGDHYVRRQLFCASLGAVLRTHRDKRGPRCLVRLLERKHHYVAICAHANRLARLAFALHKTERLFETTSCWQDVPFAGKS
jgi:transposase